MSVVFTPSQRAYNCINTFWYIMYKAVSVCLSVCLFSPNHGRICGPIGKKFAR